MKTILTLKRCVIAALFAGFIATAIAEDRTLTDQELAANAAEAQRIATLAGIANDRYGTIAGIVAVWGANLGGEEIWEAEFTNALNGASDAQLADIQNASSYDAVRAILLGGALPESLDGVAGTESLGDLGQDLVYSPVFPCRIFDTRNIGGVGLGTPPVNNQTNDYHAYGDGATMTAQGGNPGGCATPTGKGEPVGISVNMAAIPVSPAGHLRVYPYQGVLPTASFLNYFSAGNVANSGLITTCYLCPGTGQDISVFNRNTAHSFADVMGYFYPADDLGNLVEMKQGGYDIQQNIDSNASLVNSTSYTNHFQGPQNGNTTLTLTGGENVMVMASMMIHKEDISTSNNIEGEVRACYENTATPNTITQGTLFQSETDFCFTSAGENQQHSVQVSGLFSNMPAGTYRFGFCAKKGNSNGCFTNEVNYRIGGHKINVIKIRQ